MEFTRKEYNKAKKIMKGINNLLIAEKEYKEIERIQKEQQGSSVLLRIEKLLKDLYMMVGDIGYSPKPEKKKERDILTVVQLFTIIVLLLAILAKLFVR